MPQFALLAIPVFLTLNMLSGGPSPLESMPEPLQVAVQISPAMHYVAVYASRAVSRRPASTWCGRNSPSSPCWARRFWRLPVGRFRTMLARSQ